MPFLRTVGDYTCSKGCLSTRVYRKGMKFVHIVTLPYILLKMKTSKHEIKYAKTTPNSNRIMPVKPVTPRGFTVIPETGIVLTHEIITGRYAVLHVSGKDTQVVCGTGYKNKRATIIIQIVGMKKRFRIDHSSHSQAVVRNDKGNLLRTHGYQAVPVKIMASERIPPFLRDREFSGDLVPLLFRRRQFPDIPGLCIRLDSRPQLRSYLKCPPAARSMP